MCAPSRPRLPSLLVSFALNSFSGRHHGDVTATRSWPLNGEIDIVEGVNYQNTAKTALHATRTCVMDDVPPGAKTGSWDTAVGIPNRKTGVPDMTFRYAQNCFVYDPHQWINQG